MKMRTKVSVRWLGLALAATIVALALAGVASAATFSNPAPITINDGGNCDPVSNLALAPAMASPYPSTIPVSGLTGTVSDVNVTLMGLTHTYPDDVAVLLVGPTGKTTVLMADTGGSFDVSAIDLTFDDGAAAQLPNASVLMTGGFRPTIGTSDPAAPLTNGGCQEPTSFPGLAMLLPYGVSLSEFNGTDPNGDWSLYVIDDTEGDIGAFSGGWSLDIATQPTAVTMARMTAQTTRAGVLLRWQTGTEADLLGFQIYRSRGQSWQRITRSLIAAKGSVSGASYRYLDRTARRGASYRYRIKAVNRDGTATWFGPVR
jgi:subtilisin-like proprotein convertase family protein